MARACEERLKSKDGKPSDEITLKACFSISEDDMPVSKARVLMHWRLEHMSLKSEDDQPGPPAT